MRDAFVRALTELAENDKSIFFITADLGFGVFDSYAQRFPDQYLNVGVAEQNMTGVATGLGLEGRKVFTYSIANFATLRCLEQIRNDAAYHDINLTVVASGGGFTYGGLGMSHHATEDIAIMRALPGITVVSPCTAWEAYEATKSLTSNSGVGYLRIEKGGIQEPINEHEKFVLGKSIQMTSGNDLSIIATGGIIEECLKASEELKEKGIRSRVISMHTVKPIDRMAILKAIEETGYIICVEEHNRYGGLGSAVSEVLVESNLPCKYASITINDTYSAIVGSQEYLRSYYGLDKNSIVKKCLDLKEMNLSD
jgi:transketolase